MVSKKLIAAMLTSSMLSVGVISAVTPGTALAAPAAAGTQQANPESGAGTAVATGNVAPGGVLTVAVNGLDANLEFVAGKLNDGAIAIGAADTQNGTNVSKVENGTAYWDKKNFAGGNGTLTLRVPADLAKGDYWLRLLGAGGTSKVAKFSVTDATAAPQAQASLVNQLFDKRGAHQLVVNAGGFAPDAEVSATIDGEAVSFAAGRDKKATIAADAQGVLNATVIVPEGKAVAGTEHTLKLTAGDVTRELKFVATPKVNFADAAINSTTTVTVGNLPQGATVSSFGVDGNWLNAAQAAQAADASGTIVLEGVAIPNNPAVVGKNISLTYVAGGNSITVDTGKPATPDNTPVNVDSFDITTADLPTGLYQSAVDKQETALFVTRTVGRPPIKESTLFKLDPKTLKVVAEATPGKDDKGGLYGVYGIGLDNANGNIWTTNTRQDTLAVYKQSDLSLVKQMPAGIISHPRDVLIDEKAGKAYVGSVRGEESIQIFDTKTLEKVGSIKFPNVTMPMSLRMDPKTGDLYTVARDEPKAFIVHTRTEGTPVDVIDLSDAKVDAGSGVAIDTANGDLYIANQGTNNVVVYNLKDKKVVGEVNTGAQALSAEYDPVHGLVYVVNRTGGTTTVIDTKTKEVTANLPTGANSNHVFVDSKGVAYVVNKAGVGEGDNKHDQVSRIVPKKPAQDPIKTPAGNKGSSESSGPTWLKPLLIVGTLLAAVFGFINVMVQQGVIKLPKF